MDLLVIPQKKPSEVDIITPLKNLISSTYNTADKPDGFTDAITELSKLRNSAIWKAFEKYESSLEIVYRYYDQIVSLEAKLPSHQIQIPFKWKDAFDKGSFFVGRMSLTLSSLAYERVCVLFNIAALQSAVAAAQSIDSDDGLKLALKLLQQAAGIYNHLKLTVVGAIKQEATPDLAPETLAALSTLMLAQAQEIFVAKACRDGMKDNSIAKLCAQAEEFYGEAYKQFTKDNIRMLFDKEWLSAIGGKEKAYEGLSHFYQSLVCRANKSVGEEIARLEHALELFKDAQNRSTRMTFFANFQSRAQRNLTEARKDNDFIYHERIPDVNALEPIARAALAKQLPVAEPMSQNFKDLFEEMVPVAVHQALAAYDVRKNEIVTSEIAKLRDATVSLNNLLNSLNLPAGIEVTEGDDLPQSLVEKAQMVRNEGGAQSITTMIDELPVLLQRNRDILDEADRMLRDEAEADTELRKRFGEKWQRTPSEKLTELFRNNSNQYRQIINNAVTADKTVREKFEVHREAIRLISEPVDVIKTKIPRSTAAGVVLDSPALVGLKKLMDDVETIKAERDVIEHELKSATVDMKVQFLHALAEEGSINEANISVSKIGEVFGPLQKQVRESVQKQEALFGEIRSAHAQFTNETGLGSSMRDNKLKELASAYDVFNELKKNLQEGTKFYNDLTEILLLHQNKVNDYCFARKTEKEELMKDLTQQASYGATTPAMPSYGQPTAASYAQQPSNLPYPVYANVMPMPYGANPAAPYPTYYAPPPMPQGYNPYATMPYPNTYAANTFPQGPNQPGAPGAYPQQQQPPQNPW